MIALGVDPSSSAVGLALVSDGGELLWHEQWRTGLESTKDSQQLADAQHRLYNHLWNIIDERKPELMVVEQLASAQNLNTVRAILYFEAVAMVVSRRTKIMLKKPVATSVRKTVFGKSMPKEVCAQIVRRYLGREELHLPTPRSRNEVPVFTDDETDAYALGCWGVGHSLESFAKDMGFFAVR